MPDERLKRMGGIRPPQSGGGRITVGLGPPNPRTKPTHSGGILRDDGGADDGVSLSGHGELAVHVAGGVRDDPEILDRPTLHVAEDEASGRPGIHVGVYLQRARASRVPRTLSERFASMRVSSGCASNTAVAAGCVAFQAAKLALCAESQLASAFFVKKPGP